MIPRSPAASGALRGPKQRRAPPTEVASEISSVPLDAQARRGTISAARSKENVIPFSANPVYTIGDPRNKVIQRRWRGGYATTTGGTKELFDMPKRIESVMWSEEEDVCQPGRFPAVSFSVRMGGPDRHVTADLRHQAATSGWRHTSSSSRPRDGKRSSGSQRPTTIGDRKTRKNGFRTTKAGKGSLPRRENRYRIQKKMTIEQTRELNYSCPSISPKRPPEARPGPHRQCRLCQPKYKDRQQGQGPTKKKPARYCGPDRYARLAVSKHWIYSRLPPNWLGPVVQG